MAASDQFKALLRGWVAQELAALYRQPEPVAKGLLVGVTVWGKTYIDRFLQMTARSWAAPRNAASLRHNSRTVIFTDSEGFQDLWLFARDRTAAGFATQVVVIPDMIVAQLAKDADNKFALLGATHIVQVQMAARYGMGYHMSAPDLIYADGYFAGLLHLARDNEAVAHTNPSANVSILADLPEGPALTLSPEELGALTWRHLHIQSRTNLMNRGAVQDGYPPAFFNIWQGRDSLIIHSPHLSASYLSAGLCAKAPLRFYSPIDCQLPYYMPGAFATPLREHGMAYVEVSDDGKRGLDIRNDIEVFAAICWHSVTFRDEFLRFYDAASFFPIPEQADYLTDSEIAKRHAQLVTDIVGLKENVRGRIAFKEVA